MPLEHRGIFFGGGADFPGMLMPWSQTKGFDSLVPLKSILF